MNIRYIYMGEANGGYSHTNWMQGAHFEEIQRHALSHASEVARCAVLVVERDPQTGFMLPLGVAAACGTD